MRWKRSVPAALLAVWSMPASHAPRAAELAADVEVPPIVFSSRAFADIPQAASRSAAIEQALAGRLVVRESDGSLRTLVDRGAGLPSADAPADVADPDVSFDGSRIVFAGYVEAEAGWRLFEIDADGGNLLQITRSDRAVDLARFGEAAALLETYDDVDPCYLPDGRLCFVSTRSPGIAPDGRRRTTNLYVVERGGEGLRRITSERFGADTPVVEPATGRIVYSRFWRTAPRLAAQSPDGEGHLSDAILPGSPAYEVIALEPSESVLRGVSEDDFPGVNSWFLAGINPNGSALAMWSGLRLDRELSQAYRPSFLPSGEALAVFLPVTPFIGYPRGYGLRRYARGPLAPAALGGPQAFPRRSALQPRVNYHYASAESLGGGERLLVTATPIADVPQYAVYVQENAEAQPALIYDDPLRFELDAVPILPRDTPPVIPYRGKTAPTDEAPRDVEEAFALGGAFTFSSANIFFNGAVDAGIVNAPPVGEPLVMDFFMNPQRTSTTAADAPILIRSLPVPPSGAIQTELPAGVPLFEVLRRPSGDLAMGRDGQIFHVAGYNFGRAGDAAACVGCHAGHTQLELPEDPSWTNLAPSARVEASSERLFGRLNLQDFRATNVVDRRTDDARFTWSSEGGSSEGGANDATLELRWGATLAARRLVLYGTRRGDGIRGVSNQTIAAASAATYRGDEVQQEVSIQGPILPTGTGVELDPEVAFDRLVVRLEAADVDGPYADRAGAALAEVEVIARALSEPFHAFLRGDADCDGALGLTDAVVTLGALFLSREALCCRAAADTNADNQVELTDAVALLNFLFLGGVAPRHPFPACAPAPTAALTCDESGCR